MADVTLEADWANLARLQEQLKKSYPQGNDASHIIAFLVDVNLHLVNRVAQLQQVEQMVREQRERIRNLENAASEQQTVCDTLWVWAVAQGMTLEDKDEEEDHQDGMG